MLAMPEACTVGKEESPRHMGEYRVRMNWMRKPKDPWHKAGCLGGRRKGKDA